MARDETRFRALFQDTFSVVRRYAHPRGLRMPTPRISWPTSMRSPGVA